MTTKFKLTKKYEYINNEGKTVVSEIYAYLDTNRLGALCFQAENIFGGLTGLSIEECKEDTPNNQVYHKTISDLEKK